MSPFAPVARVPRAPRASRAPRGARVLLASALALGGILTVTGSAFAAEPESDGLVAVIAPPGDEVDLVSGDAAAQGRPGGGGPKASRGYDISYPQCAGAFPSNPAFGIVGTDGGRVFSANPCLAAQIAWGGGAAAELYVNTGNPGPALSTHWPTGQTSPKLCDAANPDTADCAYDYGWNAATDSFARAVAAYQSLGLTGSPAATAWWLDVETSNSWRDDNVALNIAALQGELDYLLGAGVTRLGFYSTTFQWGVITGGSNVFAAYPSWGAGARSERVAKNLCTSTTTSFTGGPLTLVQYPYAGFDADIRC
jgi:hypothetical protein